MGSHTNQKARTGEYTLKNPSVFWGTCPVMIMEPNHQDIENYDKYKQLEYDDYEQPKFKNFSDEDQQQEYNYHEEDQQQFNDFNDDDQQQNDHAEDQQLFKTYNDQQMVEDTDELEDKEIKPEC